MNSARASPSILVVDDEPVARHMLSRLLRRDEWEVTAAAGGKEALAALDRRPYDVVLVDLVMQEIDGLEVLAAAKRADAATEVILMTGHASIDTAIEAMKRGAFHYIQKPLRPEEVRMLVRQACEKRALRLRVCELDDRYLGVERIVGTSPAVDRIRQLVLQIRNSSSNVVITGESGTGKELVARAIHECSNRRERTFLAFNCAAFADELVANELFGHERDAFTGATSSKAGLLESANGGTVFFDEVGDMSPAMQAKLLRVVQERELLRVGGTRPIPIDVRIVAATNKDLKRLTSLGAFREDLFFRLNVISMRMPTLAERLEDIPALAMHFLKRIRNRSGLPIQGFSSEAMRVLAGYEYPGNVRELENIIERGAALTTGGTIDVGVLPPDLTALTSKTFRYPPEVLRSLEELERDYIEWVLERAGNNKSRAAQILGIDRASLYRKLRKRQIED